MINDAIADCICLVQCGNNSGTAFLLNSQTAITAYHTIAGCEHEAINLVFTTKGETYTAFYIAGEQRYKEMDIALLSLPEPVQRPVYLEVAVKPLRLNEQWYSRGYPIVKQQTGENLQSPQNVIQQILPSIHNKKIDIQLDLDRKYSTYAGLSGAPLLVDGLVVGVINTELGQNGSTRELYSLSVKNFDELLMSRGIAVKRIEPHKLNSLLFRTLMAAIAKYNERAHKFILLATQENNNWENNRRFSYSAKEYILKSFFGILPIRKLVAIGLESNMETESKILGEYVEQCITMVKKVLSLFCFILLSSLWDHTDKKKVKLNDDQRNGITVFFEAGYEMDIKAGFDLFILLINVFAENNLTYPIPELNEFKDTQNEFVESITKLAVFEDSEESIFSWEECLNAEVCLCNFLSRFSFLARHEMVSLKGITYDAMHKAEKHYIHDYYPLVSSSSDATGDDGRSCHDDYIATDSVILFDKNYKDGIRLFPFIIDLNALQFERKSMIYFYRSQGHLENSLNYISLEDSKDYTVTSTAGNHFPNMDEVVSDKDRYKQHKLNKVFAQFLKAKNAILG